MACTVSTGKSGRWLDRLRAARGFPESDATNLEGFLQNPTQSSTADHRETKANANPVSPPPRNGERDLRSIVTGVLHELFNFGDTSVASGELKKSCRKQLNPKVCRFSNDRSHGSNNVSSEKAKQLWRSEDTGSGVEGAKQQLVSFENEEEEGDRDVNFTGFSRTEVTVIDTSYGVWKFEKMLFRKKNMWRVRDKKGKKMFVTKKRKLNADGVEKGRKLKADDKIRGHDCEAYRSNDHEKDFKQDKIGGSTST